MDIRNVLFELNNEDGLFSSSATFFDRRWVLLPGISFLLFLHEKTGLPIEILKMKPLEFYNSNHYFPKSTYIKIILDTDAAIDFEHKVYPVKYVGSFSSKNIVDSKDFPLKSEIFNKYKVEFTYIMSLFFLFECDMYKNFDRDKLNISVKKFLSLCNHARFSRGSRVCIDSVPFGRRQLLTSQTNGIVANMIGKEGCFMLTDAATAPGSEGGIVFCGERKSSRVPIGIVVSSLNSWRGEHIGLTLCSTLKPLLEEFLYGAKNSGNGQPYYGANSFLTGVIDNCIAKVLCGNEWGTAVLWDKENGIFVTASHVVKYANLSELKLKWRDTYIPCSVLYKTTETLVYDIAVLYCDPKCVRYMCQIPFTVTPAKKGEDVFAAGFPIFSSESDKLATVSKGNITLCNESILHTNSCVLPGSSGGAILRLNGDLLGIIICHTTMKIHDNVTVYPKINMAVPVTAIINPLDNYIKTKDILHLKNLNTVDENVIARWNLFPSKL